MVGSSILGEKRCLGLDLLPFKMSPTTVRTLGMTMTRAAVTGIGMEAGTKIRKSELTTTITSAAARREIIGTNGVV